MDNMNIFERSAEAFNKIQNLPEIEYITEMSDYSDKYGIGYLLKSYNIGVIFRDNTKIIFRNDLDYFYYINNGDENQIIKIDVCQKKLNESIFPPDKKVKYEIFLSFHKYFTKNRTDKYQNNFIMNRTESVAQYNQVVHVTKYFVDKYAIFFRFNNGTIQAIFQDNSSVLLDLNKKFYYYIDKEHNIIDKSYFESRSLIKSEGFKRRLNYAYTILHKIVKKKK